MSKFDVFLSHNSVDKPWVINLKEDLCQYGLSVWLDKDEIRPGDLFAKALEDGLENSKSVALIVSPESMASGWVKAEYYRALSLAQNENIILQLIPVILRSATLPGFAQDRNHVNFQDEFDYNRNVWQLVWGITGIKPDKVIDLIQKDLASLKTIKSDQSIERETEIVEAGEKKKPGKTSQPKKRKRIDPSIAIGTDRFRPPSSLLAYSIDRQNVEFSNLLPFDIGTIWGLTRGRFIGIVAGGVHLPVFEDLVKVEGLLFRSAGNQKDFLPTRWWVRIQIDDKTTVPETEAMLWQLAYDFGNALAGKLHGSNLPEKVIPGIYLYVKIERITGVGSDLRQKIMDWCDRVFCHIFPESLPAIILHLQSESSGLSLNGALSIMEELQIKFPEIPIEAMEPIHKPEPQYENLEEESVDDLYTMIDDLEDEPKERLSADSDGRKQVFPTPFKEYDTVRENGLLQPSDRLCFIAWGEASLNAALKQGKADKRTIFDRFKPLILLLKELKQDRHAPGTPEIPVMTDVPRILFCLETLAENNEKHDSVRAYFELIGEYSEDFAEDLIAASAKSSVRFIRREALVFAVDSEQLVDAWIMGNSSSEAFFPDKEDLYPDHHNRNRLLLEPFCLGLLRYYRREGRFYGSEQNREQITALLRPEMKVVWEFSVGNLTVEEFSKKLDISSFAGLIKARSHERFWEILNDHMIVDLDNAEFWWMLLTTPMSKTRIAELMELAPEIRAIFGLCNREELEEIENDPVVHQKVNICRRIKSNK